MFIINREIKWADDPGKVLDKVPVMHMACAYWMRKRALVFKATMSAYGSRPISDDEAVDMASKYFMDMN